MTKSHETALDRGMTTQTAESSDSEDHIEKRPWRIQLSGLNDEQRERLREAGGTLLSFLIGILYWLVTVGGLVVLVILDIMHRAR